MIDLARPTPAGLRAAHREVEAALCDDIDLIARDAAPDAGHIVLREKSAFHPLQILTLV
jgi:hypothetical protein